MTDFCKFIPKMGVVRWIIIRRRGRHSTSDHIGLSLLHGYGWPRLVQVSYAHFYSVLTFHVKKFITWRCTSVIYEWMLLGTWSQRIYYTVSLFSSHSSERLLEPSIYFHRVFIFSICDFISISMYIWGKRVFSGLCRQASCHLLLVWRQCRKDLHYFRRQYVEHKIVLYVRRVSPKVSISFMTDLPQCRFCLSSWLHPVPDKNLRNLNVFGSTMLSQKWFLNCCFLLYHCFISSHVFKLSDILPSFLLIPNACFVWHFFEWIERSYHWNPIS